MYKMVKFWSEKIEFNDGVIEITKLVPTEYLENGRIVKYEITFMTTEKFGKRRKNIKRIAKVENKTSYVYSFSYNNQTIQFRTK